jgi:hypothetical protein
MASDALEPASDFTMGDVLVVISFGVEHCDANKVSPFEEGGDWWRLQRRRWMYIIKEVGTLLLASTE